MKAWGWKGFTVLYDDNDALRKIQGILKLADDKGYLVAVRQLKAKPGSGYRLYSTLNTVFLESGRNYLKIFCRKP